MKNYGFQRQAGAQPWRKPLRWLAFFVTSIVWLTGYLAGAADFVPSVDDDRIRRLLAVQYPPKYSQIQCHGTAMAATGVLSILEPVQINSSIYDKCFREINRPVPGDYGMFRFTTSTLGVGHTFTVINDHQIFQKANSGWDTNPFETISITSLENIRTYFPNYSDEILVWTRYTPSPNCLLTRFQNWIEANRNHPDYRAFILDQEAFLRGERPRSTRADYLRLLEVLDRINSDAMYSRNQTLRDVLLAAFHEYLIRPEFASYRQKFVAQTRIRYLAAIASLRDSLRLAKNPNEGIQLLKTAFGQTIPTYNFKNIAVFDNAHSGFLRVPEGTDFPEFKNFDATSFNQEQDHVTIRYKRDGDNIQFYFQLKGDPTVWSFSFSRSSDNVEWT